MKDCVSLDVAKKLREAGWPQIGRAWGEYVTGWHLTPPANGKTPNKCAAPTIGELLEALGRTRYDKGSSLLTLWMNENLWADEIWFACVEKPSHHEVGGKTPADALALLWMALKEKGVVC